ncbi:MAG: S8 family serine peptidase, partial [Coriobacteriales bacterium]|nr:S8 family serine peptidase [Coriobacteriales bacterium]
MTTRAKAFVTVLACAFALLVCLAPRTTIAQNSQQKAQQGDPPFSIPEGTEYEEDVVLVGLPAGQDANTLASVLVDAELDGVAVESVQEVTNGIAQVTLARDSSVEEAVNSLETSGLVRSAQPNYVYRTDDEVVVEEGSQQGGGEVVVQDPNPSGDAPSVLPPDEDGITLVAQNAHDEVNDPRANEQWALDSMDAGDGWRAGLKTNGSVGVVVLDVGFDVNHADLKDNIPAGAPYNVCTGTSDVCPTDLRDDHGTHVAGIIAARANNGIGVAGVSYNAKIIPVCVSQDSNSASSTSLALGCDYAVEHKDEFNIRVINISMGSRCDTDEELDEEDHLLLEAIDRAYKAGIVVVTSAGNYSEDGMPYRSYPAHFGNVVSVNNLACDGSDPWNVRLASSSNYNVDDTHTNSVSAPGTSILSTTYGGGYDELTGTSMAAPQAAGVLAIIFSQCSNLSAEEGIQVLCNATRDLGEAGWDRTFGWGEVDVAQAAVQLSNGGTVAGPEVLALGGTATYVVAEAQGEGSWTFSSTDTTVLTIDPTTGEATASSENYGTTLVVATCGDKRTCKVVNVVGPLASTYAGRTSVGVGSNMRLRVGSLVSYAWDWTSQDPEVATVTAQGSLGIVVGKQVGETTITATMVSDPNISFTMGVTVTQQENIAYADVVGPSSQTYTGSALTPKPTRVAMGSQQLVEGTDYTLRYQDNVLPGMATIYIDGMGSFYGTAYIPFWIAGVVETGVTLNRTSASVVRGQSVQLAATVRPSNATVRSVTWSSSNNAVAAVNASGKVTGVSAGRATITVHTRSGKTATCTVTVTNPPSPAPSPS